MGNWKSALEHSLQVWDRRHIVTSPDIDGLISTALLLRHCPAKLIGFYTTQHLLLCDGYSVEDALGALWLEQDVSHSSIVCVGQHLILHDKADLLPRRNTSSFNPNVHFPQAYQESFRGSRGRSRDKYPFATCHMLLHLMGGPRLNKSEIAMMAHADSTFASICRYTKNCDIWKEAMFPEDPNFSQIYSYAANMRDDASDQAVLKCHKDFIRSLADAKIKKSSSETKNRPLPSQFEGMTGWQTIDYRKNYRPDTFVNKLNRVSRVIGLDTRFELPKFDRIDRVASGTVKTVLPNKIEPGTFDEFMGNKKIFSHAIKSHLELRYTVMVNNGLSE